MPWRDRARGADRPWPPLGRLRWLGARLGWSVAFDKLGPARWIRESDWVADEAGLMQAAATVGVPVTGDELRRLLDGLPSADPWRICRGHDLVEILVLGLRRALGSAKPSEVGAERLASLLRQAYESAELERSALGRGIRHWESRNRPYRVLPPAQSASG